MEGAYQVVYFLSSFQMGYLYCLARHCPRPLIIVAFLLAAFCTQAQTISGTVFRDYDADGLKDATEPLVGGITVRVYDNTNILRGTTSSTVVLSGTNYSVTPTGTAPYRVEFIIPPTSASICGVDNQLDFDAMVGVNTRTSVQFVSTVPATVSFGITNANQYASPTLPNPKLFTSCYVSGNNFGTGNVGNSDAFIGIDYNPTNNTTPSTPAPAHYATTRQIGSTWGVAYSKQAKRVFTSAVLKRHSGMGPLGSGGIYMINPALTVPSGGTGSTGVTSFLDFDAIGIPTRATGTYSGSSVSSLTVTFNGVVGTNEERNLGTNLDSPSRDAQAVAQSGRVSFGDLDISDDGRYLYVMNLYDRKLYEIDLTDPLNPVAPTAANRATKIRSWDIPNPGCTSGQARPWAVDYYRGKPYIGVVCDAATSQAAADLKFTVYELDPATGIFSAEFTSALNFSRGLSNGFESNGDSRKGWFAWTDDWGKLIQGTTSVTWPQPILSDLEFDTDGSMVLAFIDRSGLQGGWFNWGPVTGVTTLYKAIIGGDMLRAYKRPGDCNWELESAGKEGPSSSKPATGGATNGEGPGGGEFYYEEAYQSQHRETALGGLAIQFGSGEVVATIYDPFRYDSFGLGWFNNTTGAKDKGFEVYETGFNGGSTPPSGTFSKGLTLGDVEIQAELAPIQIGNRVWNDLNNNGTQDPGEPTLAGIPVILKGPGLPPAGTTVTTGSNGEYYFSNATGTNATGFVYSLTGLTSGSSYSLCFPLTSSTLTLSSKPNSATGTNADAIDSDPTSAGIISFTLGSAGQNNFSYDAGYTSAPPCTLTLAVSAGICNPATNGFVVSGTVTLGSSSPSASTVLITDNGFSTSLTVPANATSATWSLSGITSNGAAHTVVATLAGCGSATANYTAPAACITGCPNSTVANASMEQGSFPASATAFAGGLRTDMRTVSPTDWTYSTDFSVGGNFWVQSNAAHTGNKFLYLTTSGNTDDGNDACSQFSVSGLGENKCYQLCVWAADAKADGQASGLTLAVLPNAGGSGAFSFTAVALPDNGNWSDTQATGIPWRQYCYTFTVPPGGTGATVWLSANAKPGLSGPTANVVIDDVCLTECTTCTMSVVATATECSTLTNQYSVTGNVVVRNNPGPVSLTVSVGTSASTVLTMNGNGISTYTLSGLPSDGLTRTVTVISSGSVCGMASVTYTAPAGCTACTPISVQPSALPNAQATAPYNQTLTGSGGLAPYAFAVVGGSLPANLSLSAGGIISGIPLTSGITSVTVRVTDSRSCSALIPFTLTIGTGPVCSLTATATPGVCQTANNTYTLSGTVSATNGPSSQTLTVGVGSISTIIVLSGNGPVSYTLPGLPSVGSVQTLTITSSAGACGIVSQTFAAPAACATNLDLDQVVNKAEARVGDVITYTVVLINNSSVPATNVVVQDVLSAGMAYVANSTTATTGTFTATSTTGGIWTIASLPGNATVTLTFSASVLMDGVQHSVATIPGDEAKVCTAIPIEICKGTPIAIELNGPGGYTRYQWYLTTTQGTTLVSDVTATSVNAATANSFTATREGEYKLVVDQDVAGSCPDLSCCPVIIREIEVPLFTAQGRNPTCVNNAPQATGQLSLSGLGANLTQYTYQISAGSSFSASGATSVQGVPANGVLSTSLTAGTYTVRIFHAQGCYRDATVTLSANCVCPPNLCMPVAIRKTKSRGVVIP